LRLVIHHEDFFWFHDLSMRNVVDPNGHIWHSILAAQWLCHTDARQVYDLPQS